MLAPLQREIKELIMETDMKNPYYVNNLAVRISVMIPPNQNPIDPKAEYKRGYSRGYRAGRDWIYTEKPTPKENK